MVSALSGRCEDASGWRSWWGPMGGLFSSMSLLQRTVPAVPAICRWKCIPLCRQHDHPRTRNIKYVSIWFATSPSDVARPEKNDPVCTLIIPASYFADYSFYQNYSLTTCACLVRTAGRYVIPPWRAPQNQNAMEQSLLILFTAKPNSPTSAGAAAARSRVGIL